MALMSSTEIHDRFNAEERKVLLGIAADSIHEGLESGSPVQLNLADYPENLQEKLACFVTLNINHNLRGCIGHLAAVQPLVLDVAENAYSAAFRDPRFQPLSKDEFREVSIHISILSPSEPMSFSDEQDLLRQIRPGIDGLILEEGHYRGTFLPSVWESLKTPEEFLNHLKMKAGLPAHHWSDRIKVQRYTTESFT